MLQEFNPSFDYVSAINQLDLLLKHGPLGVKVVEGKFVKNSIFENIKNYSACGFSIFTSQTFLTLTRNLDLLEKKIKEINQSFKTIVDNQLSYPDYFLTSYKTIL